MERRHVLAVLGGVTTSGCLRLAGSSTPDRSPTIASSTTTTDQKPSPSPTGASRTANTATNQGNTPKNTATTEDSTPTEDLVPDYPTGLSDSGISNAAFLFATHASALQETSFRAQWSKFDRTNSRVKWKKEYRSEPGEALGNWIRDWGAPIQIYRNQQVDYWREDIGDSFNYGEDLAQNQGNIPEIWGIEVKPLLKAAEWSKPSRVNENQPAVWELTSSSVANKSNIPGYHDGKITSIGSASMRVDESGIIRKLKALYQIRKTEDGVSEDGESGGQKRTYESSYSIDSIGKVSVNQPSWVSTAKNEIPSVFAELTDNNLFIRFTIESGNPILANSTVFFQDEQSSFGFGKNIEEPIEQGNDIYFHIPDNSAKSGFVEAEISRGSRPSGVNPQELTSSYLSAARRRATHYYKKVNVQN